MDYLRGLFAGFDPAWLNWEPTINHFLHSFPLTRPAWTVSTDHCVMVPAQVSLRILIHIPPDIVGAGWREGGSPILVVRLEPESFFPPEYVLLRSRRRDKTRGNYTSFTSTNVKLRLKFDIHLMFT